MEPTYDGKVKRTMEKGWGFGFKLNDATDARPSSIVFIKGRTPNDDLLLLGGTARRGDAEGDVRELDGFVTKLLPPAPSLVSDLRREPACRRWRRRGARPGLRRAGPGGAGRVPPPATGRDPGRERQRRCLGGAQVRDELLRPRTAADREVSVPARRATS